MRNNYNKNSVYTVCGVGLLSFIGGLAVSLHQVKRKNSGAFLTLTSTEPLRLAARALGWGTLCATTGVTVVFMTIKYLCGFHSVDDVQTTAQHLIPDHLKITTRSTKHDE